MVDLVHCPTDLLLFDILLYYHINLRSSIICYTFSGDISFFRYFSIKSNIFCFFCDCFWAILWGISWHFCNFISNFITDHSTSCFCCFLNCFFWSSFKRICSGLSTMIKMFLAIFTAVVLTIFYQHFCPYY